jgi:hypothetical protein
MAQMDTDGAGRPAESATLAVSMHSRAARWNALLPSAFVWNEKEKRLEEQGAPPVASEHRLGTNLQLHGYGLGRRIICAVFKRRTVMR